MDIVGHHKMKEQLKVAITAAKKRNTSLPHMLFSGAAGCGKTSSARYIADMTDSPFMSVVPNDLKDYNSIFVMLDRLNHDGYSSIGDKIGTIKPTVVFIDEVHNLPVKGQELMGLVMERFMIESNKPDLYHWVPYFTLIGATTLAGKLTKPFRDRFKLTFNFQPYNMSEMNEIVRMHTRRLGVRCTPSSINEIAKRSRGTPRIAVGYIERVRDRLTACDSRVATIGLTKDVFDEIEVDEEGFTKLEIRLLKVLMDSGNPVSLDNLSVILQEDSKSVRDFAEPYLIRKCMIEVSGRGRVITEKGRQHLKNSGKTKKLVKELVKFNYERR